MLTSSFGNTREKIVGFVRPPCFVGVNLFNFSIILVFVVLIFIVPVSVFVVLIFIPARQHARIYRNVKSLPLM